MRYLLIFIFMGLLPFSNSSSVRAGDLEGAHYLTPNSGVFCTIRNTSDKKLEFAVVPCASRLTVSVEDLTVSRRQTRALAKGAGWKINSSAAEWIFYPNIEEKYICVTLKSQCSINITLKERNKLLLYDGNEPEQAYFEIGGESVHLEFSSSSPFVLGAELNASYGNGQNVVFRLDDISKPKTILHLPFSHIPFPLKEGAQVVPLFVNYKVRSAPSLATSRFNCLAKGY